MDKQSKREIVDQLRDDLKEVSSIFLVNFKGLTVEKDTQLRRKMRENGARYVVVKNTLLKLAFTDTDFAQVNDQLVGNTALAYNPEDVVGLAKLVNEFADENDAFQFKAGVVEGKAIDLNGLETLAKLPPKEVLVSKMMYMMNYPVQGLVTALSGVSRNLVVVLDQIKQKKDQEG
ncbi:50S ribosomal protein L10 [Acanthopleuribacter pedis]|uniref:Large ribosomal subunit protein uL10 n=1 Tax=Acanthopleuribacter pedis TaxID=442870 RepID=A0A8J7U715_9BACT|nr:50S ribosomal protein L10 [Acanthopleuribacter pedis]MBO1322018.1 50S ribosomal protein L10 [Acanthopleuribacter pedis]